MEVMKMLPFLKKAKNMFEQVDLWYLLYREKAGLAMVYVVQTSYMGNNRRQAID